MRPANKIAQKLGYALVKRLRPLYLPSVIALRKTDFASEKSLRLFFRSADIAALKDEFRSRFGKVFATPPGSERNAAWMKDDRETNHALVEQADRICANKITLFGREYEFGPQFSWHVDVESGFVWPVKNYYAYSHVVLNRGIDIKFPWELNRVHHFVTLARAYRITRKETYAETLTTQLRSWAHGNPFEKGINWASTMEVAIRAINLMWAYYLLLESKELTREVHVLFQNLLGGHGVFMARNLENRSAIRGNHYLADLLGLLYAVSFFPSIRIGEKKRRYQAKEFCAEISAQFQADGSNFEGSIPYHALTTEMLLHGYAILYKCGGVSKEETGKLAGALEKAARFLEICTRPDGLAPLVGDNDSGKIIRLGSLAVPNNDHRTLLHTIDAVLQLRTGAVEARSRLSSAAFPDAGIYVLRDELHYLLVKNSALGTGGKGSHSHNDNLHVEVCIGASSYLVDPGTFTYARSVESRNEMRSTAYHNTVQIDRIEHNVFSQRDPFTCIANSAPGQNGLQTGAAIDVFTGEVKYVSLPGKTPAVHTRRIEFEKTSGAWAITDSVSATEGATVAWAFHTPFAVNVATNNQAIEIRAGHGKSLRIRIALEPPYGIECKKCFYAREYGAVEEACAIVITRKWYPGCKAVFHLEER